MALTDSLGGLSAADVAAVAGNGNGAWGSDGLLWIIVLFALFGNNGWGNGNGTNADVQRGFDQSAVMNGITGLSSAVSNGFANAEISRCNGNQNIIQGMNDLSMGLQNCCCENRAATADLKYTVATEASATRSAQADGTQKIIDKLCQLEMDGMKQNYENRIAGMQNQIDTLRAQVEAASAQASQNAQTSAILADNAAQTVALEQYLNPTARPAYIVPNPNTYVPGCAGMNGCGCSVA